MSLPEQPGRPGLFADFAQFTAYLDGRGLFRMRPGLERISRSLAALSLTRPDFRVVQVVGTNGKGSSSTFLAALAAGHGLRCALATSPHFVSVRERARIFQPGPPDTSGLPDRQGGGLLFSEADWLKAAADLDQADPLAFGGGDEALTYFELVTALSLRLFQVAGADLAVLESGLGGRYDAGSAVAADLLLYTPIALDHAEVLGPTLRDIAADKAGAMRCGALVLSSPANRANPEIREELEKAAKASGSALIFGGGAASLPAALREGGAPLGLAGPHQLENAALALEAWKLLESGLASAKSLTAPGDGPAKSGGMAKASGKGEVLEKGEAAEMPEATNAAQRESTVLKALGAAWLPGRMQFVPADLASARPHPNLILDGAHNPHGLSALGQALARQGIAPPVTIFSCLADKQPEKLAAHLRVLATGLILVPGIKGHPKAMPAADLAALIGMAAKPVASLEEALALAWQSISERLPETLGQPVQECKHPLLICGSLYLLGEFFALYPQYLNKNSAK